MSGHRRDSDPEIAGARLEREACEQRITERMLAGFFVVLAVAVILATHGSAEIYREWRSAANLAIGIPDTAK